ncbi:RING-type E3 ubiquitin transferase [Pseudoscourfieldia marina]
MPPQIPPQQQQQYVLAWSSPVILAAAAKAAAFANSNGDGEDEQHAMYNIDTWRALAHRLAAPDEPDAVRDAACASLCRVMRLVNKHKWQSDETALACMLRALATNDARARARAWRVLAAMASNTTPTTTWTQGSAEIKHRALETLRLAPDESEWHAALGAARALTHDDGAFAAAAGQLAVDALSELRDPLEAHAACVPRRHGVADADVERRRALASLLADAAAAPPPTGPAVLAAAVRRYLCTPGGVPTHHEQAAFAASSTVCVTAEDGESKVPRSALAKLGATMPPPLLALAAAAAALASGNNSSEKEHDAQQICALAKATLDRAHALEDVSSSAGTRAVAYRAAAAAAAACPNVLTSMPSEMRDAAADDASVSDVRTVGAAAAAETALLLLRTLRDSTALSTARHICGACMVQLKGAESSPIPSVLAVLTAVDALLPPSTESDAVLCSSASLWCTAELSSTAFVHHLEDGYAKMLGSANAADAEALEQRVDEAFAYPGTRQWLSHHLGICSDVLSQHITVPAGKRKRDSETTTAAAADIVRKIFERRAAQASKGGDDDDDDDDVVKVLLEECSKI